MSYKRISPQPVNEGGSGAVTLTGVLIGNGTSAFTGNAVTQHDVLVGGASNAITSVAPSATSGVPLISGGTSADPAFGTALVAGGGTAAVSFNTNGVIISNTSGTGALAALSLTSGQIVIGGTSTPAAATLSAGTGIIITNGNNTITIAASGSASSKCVMAGSATISTSAGFKFSSPASTGVNAAAINTYCYLPYSGTINNLYVNVAANASSTTINVTLYLNGVAQALTVAITASTTGLFSDTTNSVSVTAGQYIYFQINQATTGTATIQYTFQYTG